MLFYTFSLIALNFDVIILVVKIQSSIFTESILFYFPFLH